MGIYRGAGGTGDAVNDAASEATLVSQLVTQAQQSEANAAASATAAQTAETNAETAETNAETAATNAATSEANALTSKNAAATSATNAASSASAASTSATNAANSASAASTSASAASTSATSASTSASTATTQATNASNSASTALAAQVAAEAALDGFTDIYLGAFASNPTVDNDGNALTTGDQYFNTVSNELRVWNGSTWQSASVIGGTVTSLNVTGSATFTSLTDSGNLTFTGTGNRITGDFSNTTVANRLMLQTSTTNSSSRVAVLPNGTNQASGYEAYANADPTNTGYITLYTNEVTAGLQSAINGTGTYLPMDFRTGGSERLRIDTSGNVGIGTTTATGKLTVTQATAGATAAVVNGVAAKLTFDYLGGGQSYIDGAQLNFRKFDSTTCGYLATGTNTQLNLTSSTGYSVITINSATGNLAYLDFTVNSTAAARFTSDSSGNITFNNTSSNTERMRIDSSGNLLVGTTATAASAQILSKTGANPFAAWNTATTGNPGFISFGTEGTYTERGYIYYDRTAGQTKLSATSDQRLKENIVDAASALPIIGNVKVRQYDWKETGITNIGFIAQELFDVVPRAVSVGEDNEDGSIKRAWGVDNSSLVPYLVKAVQELKAEVDSLKQQLGK